MSTAARPVRQLNDPQNARAYPRLADLPRPERENGRRDLRLSIADAAMYNVMVGLGEAYLPAFSLALGLGQILSGMASTVPMLLGAVLQLATPWAVRRVGSYRRWVAGCAALQGMSLLLLPWAATASSFAGWVVYIAATMYWASGLATGPVWNTWTETLVPRRLRAVFFGRRARISHAALLVSFLAGGAALELGKLHQLLLPTFAALFGAAAVCRFTSAHFLTCQSELSNGHLGDRHLSWGELIRRLRGDAGGRLLVYLFATQVAVQISGPYFAPYMLGHLKLSYWKFTFIVSMAYIGKLTVMPLWSRLGQRIGPQRLLVVAGIGILPLSAAWIFSTNYLYLATLQFFAGAVWGGFELAMLLLFFESIPKTERTSLLTLYNLGNAASIVVGTLLGGAVLAVAGKGPLGYTLIFACSACGRVLTLGLLRRCKGTGEERPIKVALSSI